MAKIRTSAAGGASSGTGDRTVTITPAIGDLLIVYCYVAANTNDTPTCSDNNGSGTYDRIDVANCVTSAINYRLSVFVRTARMVNTTSTVITVATGSNTSGALVAVAVENITAVGSAAVRSKGLQNNQAAGTAAPVLNQTSLTGNMTIVAQGSADTTTTPPGSWTEAQDTSQTNDPVSLEVATRSSGFAGTTITFGAASSTTFCSHALELDSVLTVSAADSANNLADATRLGFGLAVADNLNNWADDYVVSPGSDVPEELTQTAEDSLNNWNDRACGDIQPRWLDAIATDLQAGGPVELQLTPSESLNNWADHLLGDCLNRWQDVGGITLHYEIHAADSLNFWADDKTVTLNVVGGGDIDETASDSLNFWNDGSTTIWLDYEIEIWEDLDNWADDQTVTRFSDNVELTITRSDSLNNWGDHLLGDCLNRWQDAATVSLLSSGLLTIQVSDSLNNWADTIAIGYGLLLSDDANNLVDAVAVTRLGNTISLQVGDNLDNWQDAVAFVLMPVALTLSVSDDLNNWNDTQAIGYGLLVTDNANNLADTATVTRGTPNLTLSVSDSLNFWADAVNKSLVSGSYILDRCTEVRIGTIVSGEVRIATRIIVEVRVE